MALAGVLAAGAFAGCEGGTRSAQAQHPSAALLRAREEVRTPAGRLALVNGPGTTTDGDVRSACVDMGADYFPECVLARVDVHGHVVSVAPPPRGGPMALAGTLASRGQLPRVRGEALALLQGPGASTGQGGVRTACENLGAGYDWVCAAARVGQAGRLISRPLIGRPGTGGAV